MARTRLLYKNSCRKTDFLETIFDNLGTLCYFFEKKY